MAGNKYRGFGLAALFLAAFGVGLWFRSPLEKKIPYNLAAGTTFQQLYMTGSGFIGVTKSTGGNYFVVTEKTTLGPFISLGVTSNKLAWTETSKGIYFQAYDKLGGLITGPSYKKGPFIEMNPFVVDKSQKRWAVQVRNRHGWFVVANDKMMPTHPTDMAWHPFFKQLIFPSSPDRYVDSLGFGPYGETMVHERIAGKHFATRGDQAWGPYQDVKFFTRLRWFGGTVFAYRENNQWFLKEGKHLIGPFRAVNHLELSPDRSKVVAMVSGVSGDYRLVDRIRKGPYQEVLPLYSWSPDPRYSAYITRQGYRYFVRMPSVIMGPYEAVRDIQWSSTGKDIAVFAKDVGQWWVFSDWGRFGPVPETAKDLKVWPQKNKIGFQTLDGRDVTTHIWLYRKDFIGSIRTDSRGLQSGSVYYDPKSRIIVRTN